MALPKITTLDAEGNPVEQLKPLDVNLNPDEITLDEMCLFDGEGFTASGFRAFLINHTNWTKAEIGKLTVKDLKEVVTQMGAKLQAQSVPLTQ